MMTWASFRTRLPYQILDTIKQTIPFSGRVVTWSISSKIKLNHCKK